MSNFKDRQFGKLSVLEDRGTVCKCLCECGKETLVIKSNLRSGNTKSCGCLRYNYRLIDLSGRQFGKLRVLKYTGSSTWACACECGNEVVVDGAKLRHGHKESCGCYKRPRKGRRPQESTALIGRVFGRLRGLERDMSYTGRNHKWWCECECGRVVSVFASGLYSGGTRSCGCLRSEESSKRSRERARARAR